MVKNSACAPLGVRCEEEKIVGLHLRRGRVDGSLRAVGSREVRGGLKGAKDLCKRSQLSAYRRHDWISRTGNGWGLRGPSFIDMNFCVSVDTMRAFLPVSIISWAWPAQHSALVRTADVVPRTGSSAVEAALRLPFSPWDWLVVILAFVGLRTAALSWPECSRGDVSLGLDVGVLARLRALILAP